MITPSFRITQDEDFVNIIIKCPYIKVHIYFNIYIRTTKNSFLKLLK